MRKIVIGFDGSEGSEDALRLGTAIAQAESAELVVAAALAYDPLLIAAEAYDQALAEHFDQLFAQVEHQLPGVEFVRRELRDASPGQALTDLADAEGTDMIVLGSTHRGKLGRVYPGSVGERLLNGAPCAVAIAPRGYARREHYGLGVIGVGYDGTQESQLALAEAERLAEQLKASLRLIAVVPPVPVTPSRISHTEVGYTDVLRRHFRDVLDVGASKLGYATAVEAVLEEGDPAAALAAQGVELDLLVIGSRGYGPVRRALLGGVSAEVMRTAPCPVIVVPRASTRKPNDPPAKVASATSS